MSRPWHQPRFRRDHRWAPGHMSPYLELDLGARARARLERHTAECADCASVLDSLRHMLGRLRRIPPPELEAEAPRIAGAVLERLHEPADR